MRSERVEHALGIRCAQPGGRLISVTSQVVTEFVSETEPSPPRIGRSVDDRYAKVSYLNVCGVTGIETKCERKSQQSQALRNRLKIQQRTARLSCFHADTAGKVLGILEAFRCLVRPTPR
jgi:hypothetical protein